MPILDQEYWLRLYPLGRRPKKNKSSHFRCQKFTNLEPQFLRSCIILFLWIRKQLFIWIYRTAGFSSKTRIDLLIFIISVKVYIFACSEFLNFIRIRHESTAWLKKLKVIHTQPTQKLKGWPNDEESDNDTKEILLSRLTIFVFILSVLFILIHLLYVEPEIP